MTSMTGNQGMAGPTGKYGNKLPSGYKAGQLQQFTPEAMKLYEQLFSHVGPDSYLSKLAGGDEELFQQIEAPALKQFSGLQGNLASRFSGMGGLGARQSSGFQNYMGEQASEFAQQLQAQRHDLKRQALMDLMDISNSLLNQRPYQSFLTKKQHKQPMWKQLLGLVSPIGGDIAEGDTKNSQNFFTALSSFI